jgi:hypothetical protein
MYGVSSLDVSIDRPCGAAAARRVLDVMLRYPCFYRSNQMSQFRTGNVFLHMACMFFSSSPLHSACSLLATLHLEDVESVQVFDCTIFG